MTDEMRDIDNTQQTFLAQNHLGNLSSYYNHTPNSSGHNSHFENSSHLGINPQNSIHLNHLPQSSTINPHSFGNFRNARRSHDENHVDSSQSSLTDSRLSEDSRNDRIEDLTDDVRSKLIESGEYDRLQELVERRLSEVGWRLRMVANVRDIVKETGPSITFDKLYNELKSSAKESVPDDLRKQLTEEIRDCYENDLDLKMESDE